MAKEFLYLHWRAVRPAMIPILAAAFGLPLLLVQGLGRPEGLTDGFYTSYILTLFACLLIVPHWFSLAALVWGCKRMNDTAALEEGRFLASSVFGREYRSYVLRTGRFAPRWRAAGVGARAAPTR